MPERGVLVHEWLSRTGGSENVFDVMAETFPAADLLCLWSDVADRYAGRELRETWLARTPLRRSKSAALPLIPATWRHRRPGGYDWALVSSHMFAHHVSFADQRPDFRKYVYVHSPARYVWDPDLDARGNGALARAAAPALRVLDRNRAQEAYSVAANSSFVRDRVRRAWRRDALVIPPPVNVRRLQGVDSWAEQVAGAEREMLEALPRPFLLGASRFVPYKRLNLVIDAGEAAGMAVVLAGAGPDEARLRARAADASVPVVFVLSPTDSLLYALFQDAYAFVFPAIEDFGIMPVESMSVGTPVIGCKVGGTSETVVHGGTGVHISASPSRGELARAVSDVGQIESTVCRERALEFDTSVFVDRLRGWVASDAVGGAA